LIGLAAKFWRTQPGDDTAHALARMRFEVGDVLVTVPAAASPKDAYLLSAVLHCFDDDTSVQALRTVARAEVFVRAGVQLEEIIHLASFGKMLVLRASSSSMDSN
jgi:hypothetical protein